MKQSCKNSRKGNSVTEKIKNKNCIKTLTIGGLVEGYCLLFLLCKFSLSLKTTRTFISGDTKLSEFVFTLGTPTS